MTDPPPPLNVVLDEQEWCLLADLLDAIVPGGGGIMSYLDGRWREGRLDIEEIRSAMLGDEPVGERLDAWTRAGSGTREARWFETLRALGWEAYLCDPDRGGNVDEAGWRRFGYQGRPKSVDRSHPA